VARHKAVSGGSAFEVKPALGGAEVVVGVKIFLKLPVALRRLSRSGEQLWSPLTAQGIWSSESRSRRIQTQVSSSTWVPSPAQAPAAQAARAWKSV